MDFTTYEAHTVSLAVDLVNSHGSITGTEYLPDPEALSRFLADHEVSIPQPLTEEDVAAARRLRERLREVFEAPSDGRAAALLNELLVETNTLPHLTDHDGSWHFHYTSLDAPMAERIAAIAAMALATVIAQGGFERLGICDAEGCRDVYVDSSRNRSRRYCNETCANRTNVAAYRARTT